jgi:polyphosphate:AMP phosphotransferase
MFEAAEVGSRISKAEYTLEAPRIRTELLQIQKRLATSPISLVILVSGVEGAGKGETVNLLLEWMDARGIEVHTLWDISDEEREQPPMWRFWRVLPPMGRTAVFFGSWYTAPIIDRVFGRIDDAGLDRALERIVEFERMLAAEDVLVVKLWLHLAKDVQRRRLRALEDDPDQCWRVTKMDWKLFRHYNKLRRISERVLRRTGTGEAPWTVIEGADARYRSLTVARSLINALRQRIDASAVRPARAQVPDRPVPKPVNLLGQIDHRVKLSDSKYKRQLVKLTGRINLLCRRLRKERRSMLLVFEGPDAAGKGGAIRRLTSAIDARLYRVQAVAAPTDEERARPYLWRFWRGLPRMGHITIYDRSWYGRVLVERIEGFCAPQDWQRAYAEINAFEEQLTDFGMIVIKFWLAISPEEQLRRFEDRETTPYKQYKLTEDDWRNRERWDAYTAAACDMIERTSTESSPWVLVSAEDKNHARVEVLQAVYRALDKAVG